MPLLPKPCPLARPCSLPAIALQGSHCCSSLQVVTIALLFETAHVDHQVTALGTQCGWPWSLHWLSWDDQMSW